MLTKLHIQNYALIQELSLDFDQGFLTITGETGAGKSILLGALGMILGNRADVKSMVNQAEKCMVEAVFDLKNYPLQHFFTENDLDFEPETIVRREISPTGKSRAFINDTPVLLDVLQKLGNFLIDIHSQHDTSEIIHKSFQLDLLDYSANQMELRKEYLTDYQIYTGIQKEIQTHTEALQKLRDSQDYNAFLLLELTQLQLQDGEQEVLEKELEVLENAEEIKLNLSKAIQLNTAEEIGMQTLLNQCKTALKNVVSYDKSISELLQRLESVSIEVDDVIKELIDYQEYTEHNPHRIAEINDRLQTIYSLQKKHQVASVQALLELEIQLANQVSDYADLETQLETFNKQLEIQLQLLENNAINLRAGRVKSAETLAMSIQQVLANVGMTNATLKVVVEPVLHFLATGKDTVELLFSANVGRDFQSLAKAASGGERSRLMLAIKRIMAEKQQLPTLILDEIDTGVSGKIADQMGSVMKEMAVNMQLISVTHLPQIAAKGNQHFKVYKQENNAVTQTFVKKLSQAERIQEIAQMISGNIVSEAAEAQAKELLGL